MIVIGSNTLDNGQSRFTADISHFMELRQNRQLPLLKRSAKNVKYNCISIQVGSVDSKSFASKILLRIKWNLN